jgi:drug/metabolite transporter (DMT)-like permease
MNRSKPALAVLCAGVAWGVISLFVRALSAAGLRPLQIAFLRLALSALIFIPFLALRDSAKLRIRLRDIWMFIGTGIISLVCFYALYFYATIHSQASVAVVLLYTSPAFVLLLSALIFKEKITRLKLLCLGMTVLGCAMVSGVFGASYRLTGRVLLAGLGSGFFYALYTIFARFALGRYDSMTVTAYTFLLGALGSLPLGRPGDAVGILAAKPILLLPLLGIAVVSTVLPYFLYTWGLQRMDSGRAAILAAVEPLVGAVLGMAAYGEPRDILKLAGIALILAAILLLNRREKKK